MQAHGVKLALRIPDSWEAANLIRSHLARRLKNAGHVKATPTIVERLEREMSAGWEAFDPDKELCREGSQFGRCLRGSLEREIDPAECRNSGD
jgi:hypothetical protein